MAAPMEGAQFFWDDEKEGLLVDMWSQHECLFNVTSTAYRDRNAKTKALTLIANALDTCEEEIKKRMQTLRTLYSKLKKPASSGSSRKSLTKKGSWVLEKLQFLLPFIKSRATVSNFQDSSMEEREDSEIHSDDGSGEDKVCDNGDKDKSSKRPQLSKKSRTRKRDDEEMELLRSLAKSFQHTQDTETDYQHSDKQKHQVDDDELYSFANYIAQSLSKMEERTRNIVKNNIQNVIFQAQVGALPGKFINQPCVSTPTTPTNRIQGAPLEGYSHILNPIYESL